MTTTIFAYGSNMLTVRMKERAPSARAAGAAFLECFLLRWNKKSNDGSGKCSIEETGRREDFVCGVLFQLDSDDKKRLDKFEELGRGYGERTITALSEGESLRAMAYYATSVDPTIRPYDWYRDLVVAGAREHRLPVQYVQALESVAAVADLDEGRAARARQLLATCAR